MKYLYFDFQNGLISETPDIEFCETFINDFCLTENQFIAEEKCTLYSYPRKIKLFVKNPQNMHISLNLKHREILKHTALQFSKVYKTFVKWNHIADLDTENIICFVKTRDISENSKLWYITALHQCWKVQHKVNIFNFSWVIRTRLIKMSKNLKKPIKTV